MSDYKLEDWIEPYKSENGLEYHIPDIKYVDSWVFKTNSPKPTSG